MAIKLIVSDIDGTIIDEFGNVSDKTREVIHRLKDYGIRFSFATGRSFDSTYRIAEALNLLNEDVGMICLNGQETYTLPSLEKTTLSTLTYEEALRLQKLGESYYLGIMYCFDDVIYFQMDDLSYRDYMIAMGEDVKKFFNTQIETINVNSVSEIKHRFEKDRIQKIAYIQSPPYMNLVADRLKEAVKGEYDIMRVGHGWTEVGILGVSKGQAVLDYAARYDIKPEEIMVFGDSENDLSMFKIAGRAVVMENGMESAKAHATDMTLSNDESGVAHFIEKYLDTL